MYQDNLSAMLLENNGILLSDNWTKHIFVRYFLIKDRIAMGDLKVKYCPTGKILDNHLKKNCKGLPYGNSDMRFSESWRKTQMHTLGVC